MNIRPRFRWFIGFVSIACLTASLLSGCNKSTLAPNGAYSYSVTNNVGTNTVVTTVADLQLYQADAAFSTAYRAAYLVCDFELKNRQYLWNISPNIKHTLDKVRPQIWEAAKEYTSAREAYIKNPTPVGLTGVDAVVAKIQQLLIAATAALGTTSTSAGTNAPANHTP